MSQDNAADPPASAFPQPPEGPAHRAQNIAVRLESPDVGWMDIAISIDDATFRFPTSYVFDPYPAIRSWLEALARGEAAKVDIDPEGWSVFLMVADATKDDIRFTVVFEHTGDGQTDTRKTFRTIDGVHYTYEWMCDVVLPRRRLVEAFYQAILDSWERPEPEQFWSAWYNTTPEAWRDNYDEPFETGWYSMTSGVVAAYVAAS